MKKNPFLKFVLRSLDTLELAKDQLDAYLDRKEKLPFFLGAKAHKPEELRRSTPSKVSAATASKSVQYQADKVFTSGQGATAVPRAKVKIAVAPTRVSHGKKPATRPAFKSVRAEKILDRMQKNQSKVVCADSELRGKQTLAYMVWALGAAKDAKISEGISVHDAATLLQSAASIKLYPVNLSRLVHHHTDLIELASQEKKTKRYKLTPKGRKALKKII